MYGIICLNPSPRRPSYIDTVVISIATITNSGIVVQIKDTAIFFTFLTNPLQVLTKCIRRSYEAHADTTSLVEYLG